MVEIQAVLEDKNIFNFNLNFKGRIFQENKSRREKKMKTRKMKKKKWKKN